MSAINDPLSFLPKQGERIQIPGGVIICDQWESSSSPNDAYVSGEITFKFVVSKEDYENSMQERAREGGIDI